jgi:hypothetical protein
MVDIEVKGEVFDHIKLDPELERRPFTFFEGKEEKKVDHEEKLAHFDLKETGE